MAFLLRILQGPNTGAEIALPETGRVRLGASDACDLLLADPMLPPEALEFDVSATAVSATFLAPGGALAGEPREKGATVALAPFAVVAFGATRLAIGPEGEPWPEIEIPEVRPRTAENETTKGTEASSASGSDAAATTSTAPTASTASTPDGERPTVQRPTFFWLVALLLVLLVFAAAWRFARHSLNTASGNTPAAQATDAEGAPASAPADMSRVSPALAAFAEESGLRLVEDPAGGAPRLDGNFATRAERREAAAHARDIVPAIRLALSDDETLRSCSEELLSSLSSSRLTVETATNRVIHLAGRAASPEALSAAVAALCADVPHVETVVTDGVGLDSLASAAAVGNTTYRPLVASPEAAARARTADLPVAGIMLTPYRCLVLRDGTRASEGAVIGGFTVEKIDAAEVTLRSGKETIAWHP